MCRTLLKNNNSNSLYDSFEIVTVREYNDYNGGTYLDEINTVAEYLDSSNAYDDPFYRVYGIYRNRSPKSYRVLGDFFDIKDAISFLYDLTGENANLVYY
jgi:hypothetical protein